MKKLVLVLALAVAGLTACNKEQEHCWECQAKVTTSWTELVPYSDGEGGIIWEEERKTRVTYGDKYIVCGVTESEITVVEQQASYYDGNISGKTRCVINN